MSKIVKSEAEWKELLTPEEYHICREGGTEPPFTGQYWQCEGKQGIYRCRCCGAALFDADTKFDSGTGWPSFTRPAADEAVGEQMDTGLGMTRTEVLCTRCDAHLGHVFPDGPEPTGLRYCINSAALSFDPAEEG